VPRHGCRDRVTFLVPVVDAVVDWSFPSWARKAILSAPLSSAVAEKVSSLVGGKGGASRGGVVVVDVDSPQLPGLIAEL